MKCSKCEKDIPADSVFCPFCGELVNTTAKAGCDTGSHEDQDDTYQKKRKSVVHENNPGALFILSILFLLGAYVSVIIFEDCFLSNIISSGLMLIKMVSIAVFLLLTILICDWSQSSRKLCKKVIVVASVVSVIFVGAVKIEQSKEATYWKTTNQGDTVTMQCVCNIEGYKEGGGYAEVPDFHFVINGKNIFQGGNCKITLGAPFVMTLELGKKTDSKKITVNRVELPETGRTEFCAIDEKGVKWVITQKWVFVPNPWEVLFY